MKDGKLYFIITEDSNTKKSERNLNLTNSKEDKTNTEQQQFQKLFYVRMHSAKHFRKKGSHNIGHTTKLSAPPVYLFCVWLKTYLMQFDAKGVHYSRF